MAGGVGPSPLLQRTCSLQAIMFQLFVLTALLLINGFFALSELAIVASSKPLLRRMARGGNRGAALALKLADEHARFLSTVQVGITLVGILAGAYGGAEIAERLAPLFDQCAWIAPHGEAVALTVVVALITYLSVVIGELVPKQIALAHPETLASWVARPMAILAFVCSPLITGLELSSEFLCSLLGVQQEPDAVTEAEVKAVLEEGAASGALESVEHSMLQRIMRLSDRDVRSVMTPRVDVVAVDLKEDVAQLRHRIKAAGHSRYPVVEGDFTRVRGILEAVELLELEAQPVDPETLASLLQPPTFLNEHTPCLDAIEVFKAGPTHIAIVLDEYGSATGIVTAADFLEAIVGAIPANYDEGDQPQIVRRADGSWLVDGTATIEEVQLEIGLEDIQAGGGYATIAGFFSDQAAGVPAVGAAIDRFGYRFEVADMDGSRIDKLLITPNAETKPP